MMNFSERLRQAIEQVEYGKRLNDLRSHEQVTVENVTATSAQDTIVPMPGEWIDARSADLPDDSQLWYQLMALVQHDKELFAMLDSLRESGTTLQKQTTMYKLVPVIDATGKYGYVSEDDFNDMTRHLEDKKETLTMALTQVHRRCAGR